MTLSNEQIIELDFESRGLTQENFDRIELRLAKEAIKNELLNRRLVELEAYAEDLEKENEYVNQDLRKCIETLHSVRRVANSDLRNNDLMKIYVTTRKALELIE